MFKDANQRHRVVNVLTRMGRFKDTPHVVIHDASQTQMFTFLSWLNGCEGGVQREPAPTYHQLKAYGDEAMLAVQFELLAALVGGSDAVESWFQKYAPSVMR